MYFTSCLRAEALVEKGSVHFIQQDHGNRMRRTFVGTDIGECAGCGNGRRPHDRGGNEFFETGDFLRLPVFQNLEVRFAKPMDMIARFVRYHDGDLNNGRLGLELKRFSLVRMTGNAFRIRRSGLRLQTGCARCRSIVVGIGLLQLSADAQGGRER